MSSVGAGLSRRGVGIELLAPGLALGLLAAHHAAPDPRSGWCLVQKGSVCVSSRGGCGEMPSFLQEDVTVFCGWGFFFFLSAKGFSFFLASVAVLMRKIVRSVTLAKFTDVLAGQTMLGGNVQTSASWHWCLRLL